MILRDISFQQPEENILFDEVLLHMADKFNAGESLRFWESPVPFIVLGRASKEDEDLNWSEIEKDNVAVLRRCSGGGTVVQGPGCLNYAVVVNKNSEGMTDIKSSYQMILNNIVKVLKSLDVSAKFFPLSDLALEDGQMKFSGNAQRRGRNYILQHGTILYDFPLEKISKYLLMPKDIPEYRNSRKHGQFVCNIAIDPVEFKLKFSDIFEIEEQIEQVSDVEWEVLNNFKKQKFLD